jgi:hypothetical protein
MLTDGIGNNSASGNDNTSAFTEAINALAKEKMDSFRRQLEALESRPVAPEPVLRSKELSLGNNLNSQGTLQHLIGGDLHLGLTEDANKVPHYKETVIWPDEDDESGGGSSKLFAVSENTGKLLKESFLKVISNPSQR